jgi:ABC-type sugar transport system permease subunit
LHSFLLFKTYCQLYSMDMVWEQLKSLDETGVNAICAGLLVVITVLTMKLRNMLYPYGSFSTSIFRPYVSSILTSQWLWRLTNWSTGVARQLTGQLNLNCFIACDCPHR